MISESLNDWGLPVDKKKRVEKVESHKDILESELRVKTAKASHLLESLDNRLKMFERSLSERTEVSINQDEAEQGKVKLNAKIHAGDLTRLVKAAEEQAQSEAMGDKEEYEAVKFEILTSLFGSKFEEDASKKISRILPDPFVGADVEVITAPVKEEDFKNAEFELEITLSHDAPVIEYGDLENIIKQEINGVV